MNEQGAAVEPDPAALERLRRELSAAPERLWERLEELAGEPAFQALLRREFPSQAARFGPALERREFLRLMGASLGVLGLAACTRQPDERILPFARSPEYLVPGRPLYFATAMPIGGAALGLLVESHMGRPTKVEGNPLHPSSLGATDALAQAAILSLYDPDRSHSLLRHGQIGTWSTFTAELGTRLEGLAARAGEGLALLHALEPSPTLDAQLQQLTSRWPKLRLARWTPLHRDQARAGAELAFGRDVGVRYRFDRARVVAALDADFLASGPGGVRHARDLAGARAARRDSEHFNRLYSIESSFTVTGAMADERLAVRPSEIELFARALGSELGLPVEARPFDPHAQRFARALARDLSANARSCIVLAGEGADPVVHALAHAMNHALHNAGATVEYTHPLETHGKPCAESLGALVDDARSGRIEALLILGGNPVYDAPADLEFGAALAAVPFRIHLSSHVDETSRLCHWHVPAAHFLESWSDVRAHDGTVSIVQPLIAPLFSEHGGGGKSAHELLALLEPREGGERASVHELLRASWQAASGKQGADFERFWRESLHDGVVAGTGLPALELAPRAELDFGPAPGSADGGFELSFRPDAAAHDGRFANNAWLQETPRPITRLTWENAALVSPSSAAELGLASGDGVAISAGGRRLEAPVLIVPGHPDGTLTLPLGYGRTSAGRLGSGIGFDAYRLRTRAAPWRVSGARVERTGTRASLACVQGHPIQEGRDLVRVTTFERFRADPRAATADAHPLAPPSLYPGFPYAGHAWGLVIDCNACLGCNACMVACQAENNVPVVGKEQVLLGREMHWLRIDRYFEPERPGGSRETAGAVQVLHQPLPCMHCEHAPCEVVCPVGATVHSDEGLNEMVYNRCVGTRYCSNNCPYKVRRFNFLLYSDFETESLKLARNPDVSVRSRGVMEKCTYCVQRISQARIAASREGRAIQEGEIQTACQAACPTQAIVFGDINDGGSAIARLREEPHHYGLLTELGTRPRTTYLAKVRNPNPELAEG